jgi:glycosyltransferase involved in cell wall biosynthesis
MEIVGLVMVRNEDLHLDRVLANIAGFCDRAILLDHGSSDRTPQILEDHAARHPGWEFRRIRDTAESHPQIAGLAGTDTWVFGVDGDEIYDPERLAPLRDRIFAGDLDPYWRIVGNVLHCDRIDPGTGTASGFLAPPCKSMTKLYNFRAIRSWTGDTSQRLHFGVVDYREGYSNGSRKLFKEECAWDDSPFRCLHACFVRRSSLDPETVGGRLNPSELRSARASGSVAARIRRALGLAPRSAYKQSLYRRGRRHTLDVRGFFPPLHASSAPR